MSDAGMFPRGWAVSFAASMALIGCDDVEPLAALAAIEISPESIDFGEVPTGQSRTVEIRIRNRAPAAVLELDRVALADATSPAFTLETPPKSVEPGAEALLAVRYTADDGDADSGHVIIESNASDAARVLVPLTSASTNPDLVVEPAVIDVGHVPDGGATSAILRIHNRGLDTLRFARIALRTEGFATEPCRRDEDCAEGRCTSSRSGSICALPCDGGQTCATGYVCSDGPDAYRACREGPDTTAPTTRRGFVLETNELPPILHEGTTELTIAYRPQTGDRGSAVLVLETNDPVRPYLEVRLNGRPENLPPVAVAGLVSALPDPVVPGTTVAVTAAGSSDPEGTPITHRWFFVRRPEGSRASFLAPAAAATSFDVDLPGPYIAGLEVRDVVGLASTNDARVSVDATAGSTVAIELRWDRTDTDLDLHLVSPGAAIGSLGDCFFDNPTPDWAPIGDGGDPVLTSSSAAERIAVTAPADGVYTIAVVVAEASPQGATRAEVVVRFDGVAAFTAQMNLAPGDRQWDVTTMSRPSGRLVPLGTVR